MKLTKNNFYKFGILGFFVVLLICISVFLILKYKNQSSADRQILSRNDYRIFVCGEEVFLKTNPELLKVKRNGLFARSKAGNIIADGIAQDTNDILLSSFFEATGATLEYSDEYKTTFIIPTETGVRKFQSGDLCEGKEADFYMINHRVETSTKPWSIYSRIIWKYFDHVLTNNYGKVPPGDCFIFIFDSEDALENPWPYCASHEAALSTGELILER